MIKLLIKKVIPDYENVEDKKVREKYGVLAGTLGVFCNCFLFILKIFIGALMNSIAIISDAFNNLSDMCSSLVSVISAKMSNRRADKEHPYGHGRIEYVSSLIVAFLVVLVGFELLTTSAKKIFQPERVEFNFLLFCILTVSILIKFWMFLYNRYIAKQINSEVAKATSADSLSDTFSTLVIIVSVFVGRFTSFPIDGTMGVLVSLMIMVTGIKISKEIIGILIGMPPTKEFIKKITNVVMESDEIIGVHDFMAHDYGPGMTVASLHAEVPDDVNIVKIHEIIDEIEKKVLEEFGVLLVIHMDPISLNCEATNKAKVQIEEIIKEINSDFTLHDFRMVDGEKSVNLIFDLVVPIEMTPEERKSTVGLIAEKAKLADSRYNVVIQVDNGY